MRAGFLARFKHIINGLLHRFGVQLPINHRDRNGHDNADDCAYHHDFDEREGFGSAPLRGDRRSMCGAQIHYPRLMLLVMANIADRMLNSKPPTPTAITMIMAGSIRLVITRN